MDRPARSVTAALTLAIIIGTAGFATGILGTLGFASGAMSSRSDVDLMIIGVVGLGLVAAASLTLLRLVQKASAR